MTINERRVFLWEVCPSILDGVLISRGNINKKLENDIIVSRGLEKCLRIPKRLRVMGDSGAFLYKHKSEPPYSPKELLEWYLKLGFSIGAHPDHFSKPIKLVWSEKGERHEYLITKEEAERRRKLTLDLAEETIEYLRSSKFESLEVIGVAQGWDINSYRDSIQKLISMGYSHIGIGGVAKATSKQVKDIVSAARQEILRHNKNIKLHVFGIARIGLIPFLAAYGVTSIDSATWYRASWIRGQFYYYDGKNWSSHDVRRFDYRKYKQDPPIPNCNCPICEAIGFDEEGICWTRRFGTGRRNVSRGFHNLYHFYNFFRTLVKKSAPIQESMSGYVNKPLDNLGQ